MIMCNSYIVKIHCCMTILFLQEVLLVNTKGSEIVCYYFWNGRGVTGKFTGICLNILWYLIRVHSDHAPSCIHLVWFTVTQQYASTGFCITLYWVPKSSTNMHLTANVCLTAGELVIGFSSCNFWTDLLTFVILSLVDLWSLCDDLVIDSLLTECASLDWG